MAFLGLEYLIVFLLLSVSYAMPGNKAYYPTYQGADSPDSNPPSSTPTTLEKNPILPQTTQPPSKHNPITTTLPVHYSGQSAKAAVSDRPSKSSIGSGAYPHPRPSYPLYNGSSVPGPTGGYNTPASSMLPWDSHSTPLKSSSAAENTLEECNCPPLSTTTIRNTVTMQDTVTVQNTITAPPVTITSTSMITGSPGERPQITPTITITVTATVCAGYGQNTGVANKDPLTGYSQETGPQPDKEPSTRPEDSGSHVPVGSQPVVQIPSGAPDPPKSNEDTQNTPDPGTVPLPDKPPFTDNIGFPQESTNTSSNSDNTGSGGLIDDQSSNSDQQHVPSMPSQDSNGATQNSDDGSAQDVQSPESQEASIPYVAEDLDMSTTGSTANTSISSTDNYSPAVPSNGSGPDDAGSDTDGDKGQPPYISGSNDPNGSGPVIGSASHSPGPPAANSSRALPSSDGVGYGPARSTSGDVMSNRYAGQGTGHPVKSNPAKPTTSFVPPFTNASSTMPPAIRPGSDGVYQPNTDEIFPRPSSISPSPMSGPTPLLTSHTPAMSAPHSPLRGNSTSISDQSSPTLSGGNAVPYQSTTGTRVTSTKIMEVYPEPITTSLGNALPLHKPESTSGGIYAGKDDSIPPAKDDSISPSEDTSMPPTKPSDNGTIPARTESQVSVIHVPDLNSTFPTSLPPPISSPIPAETSSLQPDDATPTVPQISPPASISDNSQPCAPNPVNKYLQASFDILDPALPIPSPYLHLAYSGFNLNTESPSPHLVSTPSKDSPIAITIGADAEYFNLSSVALACAEPPCKVTLWGVKVQGKTAQGAASGSLLTKSVEVGVSEEGVDEYVAVEGLDKLGFVNLEKVSFVGKKVGAGKEGEFVGVGIDDVLYHVMVGGHCTGEEKRVEGAKAVKEGKTGDEGKDDGGEGNEIKGDKSKGHESKGDEGKGNEAHGDDAKGNEKNGDESRGDEAKGNESNGDEAKGNEKNGDEDKGDEAKGNEDNGDESKGDESRGDEANGNERNGDELNRDEDQGNEANGNEDTGDEDQGNEKNGDEANGDEDKGDEDQGNEKNGDEWKGQGQAGGVKRFKRRGRIDNFNDS